MTLRLGEIINGCWAGAGLSTDELLPRAVFYTRHSARPMGNRAPSGFAIGKENHCMKNEKLRNVAIIAHVDHGKTTLVD